MLGHLVPVAVPQQIEPCARADFEKTEGKSGVGSYSEKAAQERAAAPHFVGLDRRVAACSNHLSTRDDEVAADSPGTSRLIPPPHGGIVVNRNPNLPREGEELNQNAFNFPCRSELRMSLPPLD